jgi:hypothetical protein
MAEELSKLTGESMTTAVTIALRERLDSIRQQQGQGLGLADRLLAIGKDCAAVDPFRIVKKYRGSMHLFLAVMLVFALICLALLTFAALLGVLALGGAPRGVSAIRDGLSKGKPRQ